MGALGLGVVAALLGATLVLTPVALFIFVWRRVFPLAKSIAEWVSNRMNFIPFTLFMLLLIDICLDLMIIWFVCFYYTGHSAFLILGLLVLPLLGQALFIFNVGFNLAIIRWLILFNQHRYQHFRTQFLTFAFRMVMRRAEKRQAKEKMLQSKAENQQAKPENTHNKVNKRRWRAKRLKRK